MSIEINPLLPNITTLGQSLFIPVVIINNTAAALPADRLDLLQNSYFSPSSCAVPSIGPFGQTRVVLEARVLTHKTIDQVQTDISLEYRGQKTNWFLPFSCYTGGLSSFAPPCGVETLNILQLGLPGATKSSNINSCYTSITNDYELIIKASVGGDERHCTTALNKFVLSPYKLAIWDCYGLTSRTFTNDTLEKLLDGVFPQNWGMDMVYDQHAQRLEQNKSTRPNRKIHAVNFFIPHGSLDKADSVDFIKNTFSRVKHLNPLVLLSSVDEIVPGLRDNPNMSDPKIDELKKKAAKTLNVPLNRIFLVINYTSEKKKNFNIDRNTYEILYMSAKIASENASREVKKEPDFIF